MRRGTANAKILFAALVLTLAALAAPVWAVSSATYGPPNAFWDDADTTGWLSKAAGSVYDPYIITTAQELAGLAKLCDTQGSDFKYKFFALAGDIDLGDREWFSIGWFNSYMYGWTRPFNGTFDGRGYKITGFNGKMGRYGNLFGYIGPYGTVRNLTVEGKSCVPSHDGAAILTAWADGRVENCVISGDAILQKAGRGYVGFVASLAGDGAVIRNVVTHGVADASGAGSFNYAGGIFGYAYSTRITVENCVTYADAIIGPMDAGGVIGGNLGFVEDIYNNVSLAKYMSGEFMGGVTGLGKTGKNNYWLKEPNNPNQPEFAVSYGVDPANGDSTGVRSSVAEMPVVAASPLRAMTARVGADTDIAAVLHPAGGDKSGISFAWMSSKTSVATVSGADETAVITGAAPGTAMVTLTVSNPAWAGTNKKISVSSVVTVLPAADAGSALGLTALGGNKQAVIGWNASPGTNYQVNVGSGAWRDVPEGASDYTFVGLDNGRKYTFGLRVKGDTTQETIDATPAAPSGNRPPSAPASLSVASGNRAMTLSWSAPRNDGGSAVTGYEVQIGGAEWIPLGADIKSHTFESLYIGKTYEFAVRAVNAEGPGDVASVSETLRAENVTVTAADAVGEDWLPSVEDMLGTSGALYVNDEGYVVMHEDEARAAARASLGAEAVEGNAYTPLPVVTKSFIYSGDDGDEKKQTADFYFYLDGDRLPAERPEELLVVKFLPGREVKPFTYAASLAECADMTYTVLRNGAVYRGEIKSGEEYALALFVTDDGDFDLAADEPDLVIDPPAVFGKASKQSENPPSSGGGGSGGGCGALGYAPLLALFAASMVWSKKRGAGKI